PASECPQIVAAIEDFKPTALIGVSGNAFPANSGRLFSREVVEAMARFNARPIIFALSNPTEHHECLPEQAYAWSGGKAVYAGGGEGVLARGLLSPAGYPGRGTLPSPPSQQPLPSPPPWDGPFTPERRGVSPRSFSWGPHMPGPTGCPPSICSGGCFSRRSRT